MLLEKSAKPAYILITCLFTRMYSLGAAVLVHVKKLCLAVPGEFKSQGVPKKHPYITRWKKHPIGFPAAVADGSQLSRQAHL